MEKLNFYTVDTDYVKYLKQAEQESRGFSRVPNMEYGTQRKPKFLCGIVLKINNTDYYVPVTSYTQQKPDNFLIRADNGQITSSLRFNYMFPIPKTLVAERRIANEPDRAYRALLAQELKYCISNQEKIQYLAERTYKRVLLGKNQGLVINSCAFQLLEQKCKEYLLSPERETDLKADYTPSPALKPTVEAPAEPTRRSMKERMVEAQTEAAQRNSSHAVRQPQPDKKHDLEK